MSHDHHVHSQAEDKPDHGATHAHGPASFGRAFAIGIGLNTAFVAVEATFGIFSNSVALLADAGHNMSDVLGLVIAWVASILARRLAALRLRYQALDFTLAARCAEPWCRS
ncbi:Cation diffusion facilitator family transporter (fragment) [Mesorhizobium sp. STM 4661]